VTWRDDLQRVTLDDGRELIGASFRGVPFFVQQSDRVGGRRLVVHEFAGRDDPYVEDLGRAPRPFAIEGYVIGDDYLAQRDRLLAALEDVAGPAELVHPYYGVLRCACDSLTVRETVTDGGMAMFSIRFIRAPAAPVSPVEVSDLVGAVDTSAVEAAAAVSEEFEAGYDASDAPAYAVTSLSGELEQRTRGLRSALSRVNLATQELARLDAETQSLIGQAGTLIRSPSATLGAFLTVAGAVAETALTAPLRIVDAFLEAYSVAPLAEVVGSTAQRVQERLNQQAITAALRQTLVIEAARLLPSVPFETVDEAKAKRAEVVAAIDEQLQVAGDAAFPALSLLRSAVTRAVPGDRALARIVRIERRSPVPSLVLSYQLYGAVAREQEIVDRNGAQHPAVLSGVLEVLSDG
jgi:prophage DNA circulation protein